MAAITSRQHPIVKAFKSVARGDDTRALIDGWHLLHDAVAAGLIIETIAISSEAPIPPGVTLIDELSGRVVIVTVTAPVMQALSPVRTPSGLVAIVRRRTSDLHHLLTPKPPLIVIAADMQDPGNAGAIIRSAEAGGATGVVFSATSADPWGWKALRASMGSTFRLPILRHHDVMSVCDALRASRLRLFATVPTGGIGMYEADFRGATALLIGGEGGGLPSALIARADTRVSIPMQPGVESLNAAVAAGVLVYEARRQRMRHT